jgi:ankyrin repeat protein
MLNEFPEKYHGSPGFADDDRERLGGYLDCYREEISREVKDDVRSRATKEVLEFLMRNCWMKLILQEFPFLKYSGSYWCFHAAQADMQIRFDWFDWLVDRNSPILQQWRLLNSIEGGLVLDTLGSTEILDLGEVVNDPPNLIEFAAYLGMQSLVSHILSNYQSLMEPSYLTRHKEAAVLVASYAGQVDLLRALLQQGIESSVLNRAIRLAAEKGREGVVTELLARDVGVLDRAVALVGASTYGHQKIAEMVLDGPPLFESALCASLMATCIGGHESVVAMFLQHFDSIPAISHDVAIGLIQRFEKQDLDHLIKNYTEGAKDLKGAIEKVHPNGMIWTPLMLASLTGEGKVVSLLLTRGGTPTFEEQAVEHEHEHALALASGMGYHEVVGLLLKDAQVDIDLTVPMANACLCNKEEVVQILLEKNKDLSWQELLYGRTALHLAASRGHEALVSRLLLEISNTTRLPCSKDDTGRTPFFMAAENGHATVCRILMEKCGPDLDISDEFQWGVLFYAARNGHVDVVHLLNEFAEGRNSCDHLGRTVLSYAAENGHVEVARLLLRKNAEGKNAYDQSGRTPLSYAAENGRFEIVQLLLVDSFPNRTCENGSGPTPLSYAVRNGNWKDGSGRTPLSYAAENGHFETVRLFLKGNTESGNSRDLSGRTPLSYAAEKGHFETVQELLIESGEGWSSLDFSSRTPLSYAVENGNIEVVRLLVENGADLAAKGDNGETALHIAV